MHKDERGEIEDLLVTDDYSVTRITFTEGAVRGNHYHKDTVQFDMVMSGKLICGQDDNEIILKEGEAITHEAGTRHAYKAIEPSEILSICFGKRRGEHYEEDTFRLLDDEKLL